LGLAKKHVSACGTWAFGEAACSRGATASWEPTPQPENRGGDRGCSRRGGPPSGIPWQRRPRSRPATRGIGLGMPPAGQRLRRACTPRTSLRTIPSRSRACRARPRRSVPFARRDVLCSYCWRCTTRLASSRPPHRRRSTSSLFRLDKRTPTVLRLAVVRSGRSSRRRSCRTPGRRSMTPSQPVGLRP